MDNAQREQIATAIRGAMDSFQRAERARDPDALLAHFASIPEFHLYSDGERMSYDVASAVVRRHFPTLQRLEGGFVNIDVFVLAPDAALATGVFREATTDGDGNTTRARGVASWLWRLIDGRWMIVYGHVDHRPDQETQAHR